MAGRTDRGTDKRKPMVDSTKHPVVDRATWLKERMALLRREKMVTRELDLLAIERQKLPWVKVDKAYTLETCVGSATLSDLFGSYRQLIIYHFMYGPEWSVPLNASAQAVQPSHGTDHSGPYMKW